MPQLPHETVDQTEVSKDFLEPLGCLTIWFSLLETELNLAIWRIVRPVPRLRRTVCMPTPSFRSLDSTQVLRLTRGPRLEMKVFAMYVEAGIAPIKVAEIAKKYNVFEIIESDWWGRPAFLS